MRLRFLSATAVGSLLAVMSIASPTIAGGPTATTEETPVAAEMASTVGADWQGSYAGIAFARPSGDNFWVVPSQGPSTTEDFSGNVTSITGGHDWQRGNLVYGVGLTYGSGDITATPQTNTWTCNDCSTNVSKMASLRGRIGLAMGKTLIYATGGIVRADAEATLEVTTSVGSDTLNGTVFGIGVEHRVGGNLSVSLEYLKTDLGRFDLTGLCSVDSCYTDIEFGQTQLGLTYRF